MKLNTSRKAGFTLVEIMIVVAIIGLLAAIAIPNFVKARARAQTNACIANLKQIEGAKETYFLEKKTTTAPAMGDLVPDYIKSEPTCPTTGTAYTIGDANTRPTCASGIAEHVLP